MDVHDTTTTNSDLSSLSSSIPLGAPHSAPPADTAPAPQPPTLTRKSPAGAPSTNNFNRSYANSNSFSNNYSNDLMHGTSVKYSNANLVRSDSNYSANFNGNANHPNYPHVRDYNANDSQLGHYRPYHFPGDGGNVSTVPRRRSDAYGDYYQSQQTLPPRVPRNFYDDAFAWEEDFARNASSRRSDSCARYSRPTQHKSSQTELDGTIVDPPLCFDTDRVDRDAWRKSASCKELTSHSYYSYNDNFMYSSLHHDTDRRSGNDHVVTKFDDTHKSTTNLSSKQSSFDRDVLPDVLTETKIYSSSYPGTTSSLSDSSAIEQPTKNTLLSSSYEEMYDDVSHDSYEVLEDKEGYRDYYDPNNDGMFMSNESIRFVDNLPPDGCDYSPCKDHDEVTFHENFNLTPEMIESVNDPVFASEEMNDSSVAYGNSFERTAAAPSESFHECDLNFVEPKYTQLNFNEFNEICKRGYSRSRELLNFDLIGSKNSVERTKSDPYVNVSTRRPHHHHRHHHHHRGHTRYHYYKKLSQPNVNSTTDKTQPVRVATSSDGSFETLDDNVTKSAIDIPYILHKRHVMNGTAREGKKHSPKRPEADAKDSSEISLVEHTYNNSKDSGLSLSVGTEVSTDENGDLSPPDILLMNKYDKVLTTSESSLIADVIGVTKRKNSSGSERKMSTGDKKSPALVSSDIKKEPKTQDKERERKFSTDSKKMEMVKTAMEKFAEKRIEKVRDSSEKLGEKRRNSLEKLKEMEKFGAGSRRGSVEKVRDSAEKLGEKRRNSLEKRNSTEKRRESLEKLRLKDSIEIKKEKDAQKRESLSEMKANSIEESVGDEERAVVTDTESVTSDELPKKDHCGKLKETFGNLKDSLELAKQSMKSKHGRKELKDSLSSDSSSSIPPSLVANKMDSIADEEDEIISELKNETEIEDDVKVEPETKSSLKEAAEISIEIQKSDDEIEMKEDVGAKTAELTKKDTLDIPGSGDDKPPELSKVRSMDEQYNSGSKKVPMEKVRQVKSAEYVKRSSFEKQDSKSSLKSFRQDSFGSTKGGVKVIKIDSDDICTCDKVDSSEGAPEKQENNVIIVEYRSTKKKKLTKRSSSGSKDKEEIKVKERTSSTSSMEKESISPCRPDSISPCRAESLSPYRSDSMTPSPKSTSPKAASPRKDGKPTIKPKPKIIKIDTKKDGTIVLSELKKSKSLEKEIEKKPEPKKSKSIEKEDKDAKKIVVKKAKSLEKKAKPSTEVKKPTKESSQLGKVEKIFDEKKSPKTEVPEKPKSSKHALVMENPTIKIQKCTSEEKFSSSEESENIKESRKTSEGPKNGVATQLHRDEATSKVEKKKKIIHSEEKMEGTGLGERVDPIGASTTEEIEATGQKRGSKPDTKEGTKMPKAEILKYVVSKLKNVDIKPKSEANTTSREPEKCIEKPRSLKIVVGKMKEVETKNDKSPTSNSKKPLKSPESQWKKFSELPSSTLIAPKRERSPILFARLGLSDGSAYVPTSPSVSRRAKSLDSPVVSLQNLPPVTSFSSKDDTLESEDLVELEVKSLKQKLPSISDEEEIDPPLKVCPKKADVEEVDKKKHSSRKKNKEMSITSKPSSMEKQDTRDTTTTDEESEKLIKEKKEKIKILKSVVSQLKEIKRKSSKEGDELVKEKSVDKSDSFDLDKVPEAIVEDTKAESIKPVSICGKETDDAVCSASRGKRSGKSLTSSSNQSAGTGDMMLDEKSQVKKCSVSSDKKKSSGSSSGDSDKDVPRKVMNLLELDEVVHSKQSSFEVSADTIIDEVPEGFLDSTKNSFDAECNSEEKTNVSNTIKELLTLVNSPRDDQSLSPRDTSSLTPERRSSQSLTPERKSSTSVTPERRSSGTPERRSSTRQERLDSFKKLKNFSMDIWNSDEVERNINPHDKADDEFGDDDDAFLPADDEPPAPITAEPSQEETPVDKVEDVPQPIVETDNRDLLSEINRELLEVLNVKDIIFEVRTPVNIPEKRSFDEDPSTSSYGGKQFPLESSGSSSLDEVNLPVDDFDEACGELDEFPTNIAYPTHAELMLSNFNSNMYLNRTLSRISERSTTSEQERSDFEDDISSKPSSSRSVSVDDESLMSSDRQPSLSSDPPSIHEDPELPPLPPLPMEPMKSFDDPEWPSPPEALTPLVTSVENYFNYRKEMRVGEHCKSVLDLRKIGESSDDDNVFRSVFPPPPEQFTPLASAEKILLDVKDDFDSDNDSKTLEGDEEPEEMFTEDLAAYDDVKLTPTMTRPRSSVGDDTSLGDWSSSTGTTVLHCRHLSSTGLPKSDDSSLAGFSLSNEVLNESNSRKNSEEFGRLSSASASYFPVKQRSFDGFENSGKTKLSHYVRPQRSFDEYDSPYTESEDNTESRTLCFTESDDTTDSRQLPYPLPLYKKPMYTLTSPTKHAKRKLSDRSKKHQMSLATPLANISSSFDAPRTTVKTNVRSKSYSYYSLNRSQPSDDSSSESSLDKASGKRGQQNAPNTIPRVSKRKRKTSGKKFTFLNYNLDGKPAVQF